MGKIIKMEAMDLYIDYWERWHKLWFNQLKDPQIRKIGGWKLPCHIKNQFQKGNQDNHIHKYFPEPYLHKGEIKNVKYIFLNINPGGGSDLQDYDKNSESNLYSIYFNHQQGYRTTMNEFLGMEKINNKTNKTAEWYTKRVKWTKSVFGNENVSDGSVLCADLIPWHSKKESDVIDYISQNYKDIFKRVIEPLIRIANATDSDNPKIFIRGVAFFNLINTWLSDTTKRLEELVKNLEETQKVTLKEKYEKKFQDFNGLRERERASIEQYVVMDSKDKFFIKFNSYLARYKFTLNDKSVYFYIFSGGSNMDLPNPEYDVLPILQTKDIKPLPLKDFIINSSHNSM